MIPKPILNQENEFKGESDECASVHEPETEPKNSFASFKIGNGMTPIGFFKYLQGKWRIDREVSDYGHLMGEAELIQINVDSLKYREDLILESSYEKWHREYVYSYEDGNIIKYFSDGRLFYPLQFKCESKLSIIGEHLCDCDLYKAVYRIKNEEAFSLEYTVDGPNKSYKIITKFVRL